MSDDKPKMAYEVTIDQPGLPKGALVSIPGLGEYENGSTFEVTKEEADAFRSQRTETHLVEDEDGNVVVEDGQYVTEQRQGPTLLQAFDYEGSYVQVSTVANQQGGGN